MTGRQHVPSIPNGQKSNVRSQCSIEVESELHPPESGNFLGRQVVDNSISAAVNVTEGGHGRTEELPSPNSQSSSSDAEGEGNVNEEGMKTEGSLASGDLYQVKRCDKGLDRRTGQRGKQNTSSGKASFSTDSKSRGLASQHNVECRMEGTPSAPQDVISSQACNPIEAGDKEDPAGSGRTRHCASLLGKGVLLFCC